MENKHQAYNTLTGEVITTTKGNDLKRIVAFKNRIENRWSTPEFCRQYAKSWHFNHEEAHKTKYTVVVVYVTGDREEVYTTTEQHKAIRRVNAILAFNDGVVKDCYCKIK